MQKTNFLTENCRFCIREECVGPCETVEEIPISDEEMERIMAYLDSSKETIN